MNRFKQLIRWIAVSGLLFLWAQGAWQGFYTPHTSSDRAAASTSSGQPQDITMVSNSSHANVKALLIPLVKDVLNELIY